MTTVPFAPPQIGYQWIKIKDFVRWKTAHLVLAVYYGEDSLYILVREEDEENKP